MNLEIKALTPDLNPDYFDFFDNRAFSDHAEWSCCYCTFFHMDKAYERRVGEEVKADGGGEAALRHSLRNLAKNFFERRHAARLLGICGRNPNRLVQCQ